MNSNLQPYSAPPPAWGDAAHNPAAGETPAYWSAPLRRWRATLCCAAVAALVAGAAARQYGQSLYMVEGTLIHTPLPLGENLRGEYTPPSAQTLIALVKSQHQLDAVVRELELPVATKTLDRCLRVTRPQQADAVTITLEWPDPEQGRAVVDRLIASHARETLALRQEKIREGMGLLRGERESVQARFEAARQAYAALPPGSNPARLRAEWDRLSSALSTLGAESGQVRDELTQCEARIRQCEARAKLLAARGADAPHDGDDVPAAQRAKAGDLVAKIAEARHRAAEVEPQILTKSREAAALKPLLDRQAISRLEYDKVAGEVDLLAARRQAAAADLERLRRDLAELPGRELRAERLEHDRTHEALTAKLAAVQRDIEAKRREQTEVGAQIETEAVAAKRLEQAEELNRRAGERVAALERLAADGVSEFTATHPAQASAQPVGSNRKSIGTLLFVGLFGAGLSGLVGHAFWTEKRRPAGGGTCGLPVIASVDAIAEGTPAPGGGAARQLALRLRGPVNQSGGVVLFTPADDSTEVDDVVTHLARYLSLWNQNVLVLDARSPDADAFQATPEMGSTVRMFGQYTSYDIALPPEVPAGPVNAEPVAESNEALQTTDGTEFIVPTAFQNVHRLPVGRLLDDPDLLASAAMRTLMVRLAEKYDKILVIAPPAADAATSEVLAAYADAAMVVFPGVESERPQVCRAVEAIRRGGVPWVGAVVRG